MAKDFFGMTDEEKRELFQDAAKFSSFCQEFKMIVWQSDLFANPVSESDLDEMAMIAWGVLKRMNS